MSSYDDDSREPVVVPTRAPSVRRVAWRLGVLAIGLGVWAVVERTWAPLLILIPPVVFFGPFPWRRFFYETRAGYALQSFVCVGVAVGVLNSVIPRESHHAASSGLIVGLGVGIVSGITWEASRRQPSRLSRWLDRTSPWKPS